MLFLARLRLPDMNEMGLAAAFDAHFASHPTGVIKPDRDALEYAAEEYY